MLEASRHFVFAARELEEKVMHAPRVEGDRRRPYVGHH
jgi:hypothetical protein